MASPRFGGMVVEDFVSPENVRCMAVYEITLNFMSPENVRCMAVCEITLNLWGCTGGA